MKLLQSLIKDHGAYLSQWIHHNEVVLGFLDVMMSDVHTNWLIL